MLIGGEGRRKRSQRLDRSSQPPAISRSFPALSPLRERARAGAFFKRPETGEGACIMFVALSPLGERVARTGVFTSRRETGEGVERYGIKRCPPGSRRSAPGS